jgi:hypothetical protein
LLVVQSGITGLIARELVKQLSDLDIKPIVLTRRGESRIPGSECFVLEQELPSIRLGRNVVRSRLSQARFDRSISAIVDDQEFVAFLPDMIHLYNQGIASHTLCKSTWLLEEGFGSFNRGIFESSRPFYQRSIPRFAARAGLWQSIEDRAAQVDGGVRISPLAFNFLPEHRVATIIPNFGKSAPLPFDSRSLAFVLEPLVEKSYVGLEDYTQLLRRVATAGGNAVSSIEFWPHPAQSDQVMDQVHRVSADLGGRVVDRHAVSIEESAWARPRVFVGAVSSALYYAAMLGSQSWSFHRELGSRRLASIYNSQPAEYRDLVGELKMGANSVQSWPYN